MFCKKKNLLYFVFLITHRKNDCLAFLCVVLFSFFFLFYIYSIITSITRKYCKSDDMTFVFPFFSWPRSSRIEIEWCKQYVLHVDNKFKSWIMSAKRYIFSFYLIVCSLFFSLKFLHCSWKVFFQFSFFFYSCCYLSFWCLYFLQILRHELLIGFLGNISAELQYTFLNLSCWWVKCCYV